jgi:hypothetical protein
MRDQIVAALGEFYTPAETAVWLDTPQEMLGGKSASALIAEGRKDDVMAVINRLRDCVYL